MDFPRELRVGIVNNLGVFEVDSKNTGLVNVTGGLESKFLDMLAYGLKFKYKAYIPEDRQWGKPANGSWTGIIGMVIRNEVDIGLSKLGISDDKFLFVDFSYPYAIEDLTFATKIPGFLSKEIAMLYPFSRGVWLSLFLSMVVACLVFHFLLSKKDKFSRKVMFVFGSILNKSVDIRVKKLRERLVVVFWLSGAMILSFCYTALLLSFLTFPVREKTISDKRELSEAVEKGTYKCMMTKGSHLFTTLATSNDSYLVSIARKMSKNDWFIEPNKEAVVKALHIPRIAVIGPTNDFRSMYEGTIHISKESIRPMYWGIAVRKDFCCKDVLDMAVHRIVAAGLYHKTEKDFYFRMQLKQHMPVEEKVKKLTLSDVSGAMIFLVTGYMLSIVSLIGEILHKKLEKGFK